jgi:hypothetical protein
VLACGTVISEIGPVELYAWALSVALQAGLIGLLILRRNYVSFPAFTAYLGGSVAQNVADFFLYRYWGFRAQATMYTAWSIGAAVTALRLMAVLEICRLVFANYRGIWGFIWRALLICVGVTAILSMTLSSRGFKYGILYADRAVGLSEAVAIVVLLLLARYYGVQAAMPLRALAIGFFLYACFVVVNDTVLEALRIGYVQVWNLLGTLVFLGSVLIWGWGLRYTVKQAAAPAMLPASIYKTFSPDVNRRLSGLNERLSKMFKGKEPKE